MIETQFGRRWALFRARYLKHLGHSCDKDYLDLCTDSRTYAGEDLFWCLDGPSFRGSDYIRSVYDKGCSLFVLAQKHYHPDLSRYCPRASFFRVDDPLLSLQNLASECVGGEKKEGLCTIGITGSNGKTTCKEIMASILEAVCGPEAISSTQGNLNNHIGVPLTILSMKKKTRFLIVEMGTNHPGEIAHLSQMAKPDVGLITNIGLAHLEFLKNKEGVLKEKLALYNHIEKHAKHPLILINKDDEMLAHQCPAAITFSGSKQSSYHYTLNPKGHLHVSGLKNFSIVNPHIREKFNLINLLQCTLLLLHLLPDRDDAIIEAACHTALPDNNRSTWRPYKGAQVYLDAYNANPSSMRASLESFERTMENIPKDRVLLILGDMNELGEKRIEFHRDIGKLIKILGFSHVYFVGHYASSYRRGFGEGEVFSNLEELEKVWDNAVRNHDYIFLKASRSLQLERLLAIV